MVLLWCFSLLAVSYCVVGSVCVGVMVHNIVSVGGGEGRGGNAAGIVVPAAAVTPPAGFRVAIPLVVVAVLGGSGGSSGGCGGSGGSSGGCGGSVGSVVVAK